MFTKNRNISVFGSASHLCTLCGCCCGTSAVFVDNLSVGSKVGVPHNFFT